MTALMFLPAKTRIGAKVRNRYPIKASLMEGEVPRAKIGLAELSPPV
jgi:hypothetical protein